VKSRGSSELVAHNDDDGMTKLSFVSYFPLSSARNPTMNTLSISSTVDLIYFEYASHPSHLGEGFQ